MKVLGDSKEWQFIRNEKSRRDNKIELLGYKEEILYPTPKFFMTTYLQILLPSPQVKNGTSENCLPWKNSTNMNNKENGNDWRLVDSWIFIL